MKKTVEKTVTQLRTGNIVITNPKLREVVQPIVDGAANQGVSSFYIIYPDIEKTYPAAEQKNTDISSSTRQVANQVDGTIVVRTPSNAAAVSFDPLRTVTEHADYATMKTL